MNYDNQYNDEEPTSFDPLYNLQEGVGVSKVVSTLIYKHKILEWIILLLLINKFDNLQIIKICIVIKISWKPLKMI